MKAKEVLKNKFWIVEDNGKNVCTISYDNDHYIINKDNDVTLCKNKKSLKKELGENITWSSLKITETSEYDVNGYPSNCKPYNTMYDLNKKLPLFTKSEKSKSIYCAGYYIIQFNKGWVKSYCPKLITIERYVNKGPFKTELEMRQQLSIINAKRTN